MKGFSVWFVTEAVDHPEQKKVILKKLAQILPDFKGQDLEAAVNVLLKSEAELADPQDIRSSATIHQFLKKFKYTPGQSAAHTLDRMRSELRQAVTAANLKNPANREENIKKLLKTRLPTETDEVIAGLADLVLKGQNLDQVVNKHLDSKNVGGNKVILQEGAYEIIEIKSFEEGKPEKHLDDANVMAPCHRMFAGTKWCVRFKDYFDNYLGEGPLYMIRKLGKPLLLGHKNSNWLDVNDDIDFALVKEVAPLIIKTGIIEIIRFVVPAVGVEAIPTFNLLERQKQFLLKAVFGCDENVEFTPPAQRLNNRTLIFNRFSNLKDTCDFVSKEGNVPDPYEFEVDEGRFEIPNDVGDLLHPASSKVIDALDKLLQKRYEEGKYEVNEEEWDDMDMDDAIELDSDIIEALRSAYSYAYIAGTEKAYRDAIIGQLENENNGFYFQFDKDGSSTLKMHIQDANLWIKENYDTAQIEDDMNILDSLEINISEDDIQVDYEFNKDAFNESILENLGLSGS